MASNVLDPSVIISAIPKLLPSSAKKLSSPHDGIAVLLHAAMSNLAFRLIAVDDSSSEVSSPANVLPIEWNKNGPGNYTFRYRHEQSSLEFVMKVSKLGGRIIVNALAIESDKTASLDVPIDDFVSPSFFPQDLSATDGPPLIHGFISSNRVTDLLAQFKLKIVQNIMPGLRKDGYVEDTVDSRPSTSRPRPMSQEPPYIPDRDAYRIPSHIPPENPLQIGRRDLYPPPMNPENLFTPPSLFAPNSGDGMYVGPDHPIFSARARGRGAIADRGPWGGDGYLPPLGAPPGARFDPVGPGFGPFPGGSGVGGVGRGRGSVPGGGNITSPDNDEFMPPGTGDMYM